MANEKGKVSLDEFINKLYKPYATAQELDAQFMGARTSAQAEGARAGLEKFMTDGGMAVTPETTDREFRIQAINMISESQRRVYEDFKTNKSEYIAQLPKGNLEANAIGITPSKLKEDKANAELHNGAVSAHKRFAEHMTNRQKYSEREMSQDEYRAFVTEEYMGDVESRIKDILKKDPKFLTKDEVERRMDTARKYVDAHFEYAGRILMSKSRAKFFGYFEKDEVKKEKYTLSQYAAENLESIEDTETAINLVAQLGAKKKK
jgi:hypothetical protein